MLLQASITPKIIYSAFAAMRVALVSFKPYFGTSKQLIRVERILNKIEVSRCHDIIHTKIFRELFSQKYEQKYVAWSLIITCEILQKDCGGVYEIWSGLPREYTPWGIDGGENYPGKV
jgi:hypothetical protein